MIPVDLRELLQQTGLFSETQISEALSNQTTAAQPLVATLVKSGVVAEEKLLQGLAKALHLPFTRITDKEIDTVARERVPTKAVFQHNIVPMRAENGTLLVATNDPFNLTMVESIRMVTKSRVQLALCTEADIAKALKRHYGVGAETLDELMQKNVLDIDEIAEVTKDDLEGGDQEASVV